MSCEQFYRPCPDCGTRVHMNFKCGNCGGNPWNVQDEPKIMAVDLELISASLSALLADYHKAGILKDVGKIKNTVTMMIRWQQKYPIDWSLVAIALMREVLYDNGLPARGEKEQYGPAEIQKIAAAAQVFFEARPDLLNKQTFNDIASGEYSEVQEKYGKITGWTELTDPLNEFFNNL